MEMKGTKTQNQLQRHSSSSSTRGNALANPMQISCLQDININRTRVQKPSCHGVQLGSSPTTTRTGVVSKDSNWGGWSVWGGWGEYIVEIWKSV